MRSLTPFTIAVALLEFLVIGGTIVGVALTWDFVVRERSERTEELERAGRQVREAAHSIDSLLRRGQPIADTIAMRLDRGELRDSQDLRAALEHAITLDTAITGIGPVYRPGAGPTGRGRYSQYYVNASGTLEFRPIEYDYTEAKWRWYHDPMLDAAAMWAEPYCGVATRTVLVEYAVPFDQEGIEGPVGIVVVNYAQDRIRQLVSSLGLGANGYAFVVSKEGQYVVHPRIGYVGDVPDCQDGTFTYRSIYQDAWLEGNTAWNSLAVHATAGESGRVELTDEVTGRAAWAFYEPIETPGFSLGAVYFKDDLPHQDSNAARRRLLHIIITALVFLGALLTLLVLIILGEITTRSQPTAGSPTLEGSPRSRTSALMAAVRTPLQASRSTVLWVATSLAAAGLAVAIAAVWVVANQYPTQELTQQETLVQHSTVGRELGSAGLSCGEGPGTATQPVCVPTGVLIRSVDFVSGTNVGITGYIWQRYHSDYSRRITHGFLLPEAVTATIEMIDSMPILGKDSVLIRWSFSADLRQEFEYDKYPLDRQDLWVRLEHPDLSNVVLIPDLESYDVINPVALPGVDEAIVLPGWKIERSFFNLRFHAYNTNFGRTEVSSRPAPELQFNIQLKRQFLQPFIAEIVPMAVAVAMLFAMLVTASRRDNEGRMLGFSATNVVLGCAALFFVIIFQHLALRSNLESSRLIYLENFYFVTYFAFMAVSVDALWFAAKTSVRWIELGDNLVPKLAFWPAYMAVLFVLTVKAFY